MDLSNTAHIEQPQRHNSKTSRPLNRSTTTKVPLRAKPNLSLHIPQNPFCHFKATSPSPAHNVTSLRPSIPRQNSVQTRYMNMLLDLDAIPSLHNIYASFFTWILLAGFVIFPSTFTSLNALGENSTIASSHAATDILKEVKDVPLLYIAAFCSGIGAAGMIWLWVQWRANFVWLLNRIFLPGCLNSFAGLISTLTNVYSQHGGNWSVTAWATAAVTGGVMVITGGLFALYNFWLLEAVKKRHELEMGQWNKGHEYGGDMDKIGRKPLGESGSMV